MTANKPLVADRIAQSLYAHGVRHAFGIPGNDVLELIRACTDAGIAFTLAKSEAGAAFMAEAVTQVSGHPAVCIFALGPGIANGVSGIAGALQERAPIIVLGGEMAGNRREVYNHQAFDHCALMRPVTKYAAELNPQRAAQQTARALDIAMTYPRGPVFLNCPADATRAVSVEPQTLRAPQQLAHAVASVEAVAHAHALLARAKRPLALVGRSVLDGAVLDGAGPAAAFIHAWQMPFFATYKAKGFVSEHDPLCLGAVALSPVFDDFALALIREADAVVMIGFDPIELRDAWLDALPPVPTLTIERTPQTHRIFDTGQQLLGDLPLILNQLTANATPATGWPPARLSHFRQSVAHVIRPREPKGRISPSALFHAVSRRVTADLLLTVDVGAHRILANHVVQCRTPGQLLQSNGLGHMGYAIPAAIGAALATQKPVIALLGDGCALMSLGELAVVAELQAPIVSIILVDNDLALIDLKQDKLKMARQAVGFQSPDFAMLARGFGLDASDVSDIPAFEAALDAALDAALRAGKPHVIAARVDPAEYWEQM